MSSFHYPALFGPENCFYLREKTGLSQIWDAFPSETTPFYSMLYVTRIFKNHEN